MNEVIEKILKQLYEKTGRKHDAYYTEGIGLNIVHEGMPETQVALSVSDIQLQVMKATGQELNINVR
jgi:hypothetical protein